MRKRIPFILGLLWLIGLISVYTKTELRSNADSYALLHSYAITGDRIYVTEPRKIDDYAYVLDASGNTLELIRADDVIDNSDFLKVAAYKDNVYCLMNTFEDIDELNVDCVHYIVKLDRDMNPLAYSAPMLFPEGFGASSLTVNESGIYAAYVKISGTEVNAIRIGFDELMDHDAWTESVKAFRQIPADEREVHPACYVSQTDAGRFYVTAAYDGKNLFARLDNGDGNEIFKPDTRIMNLFDHKSMTLMQRIRLHSGGSHFWIVALVIGEIIIFLGCIVLRHRNRLAYVTVLIEAVLLVICFLWVLSVNSIHSSAHFTEYQDYAVIELLNLRDRIGNIETIHYDDPNFFDSDEYLHLQSLLNGYVTARGNRSVFYDALIVDMVTGTVKASSSGHNDETIGHLYSPSITETIRAYDTAKQFEHVEFVLAGDAYSAVIVTDEKTMSPRYALVTISNQGYHWEDQSFYEKEVITQALVIFIVASFACVIVLWKQSTDLRALEKAMKAMAKGATEVIKPTVLGNDTEDMWNCLAEIGQNIRRVNRTKYLMLEAYYRFAPKKIEKILGRDSITDVASGETISMSGTVAIVSTDERKVGTKPEFSRMNQLVSMVGKYQDEQKGILIGNDNELSLIKLLFFSDNRNTHDFGVDFIKEFEENSTEEQFPLSILLCFADFTYGIAGTNAQSTPYFVSDEAKQLEAYCVWFRKLGIRLVITADVKNREFYDDAVRYIGRVKMYGSDKEINLFEVLNAYKEKERRAKIDLNEKFQNALQLFYKKDFYLARSAFSEIIKDDRTDGVAKWYLFECERYLNDGSDDEFTGCLHL